jgi:hypothetical protein
MHTTPLLYGFMTAAYVLACMYAVTERNTGARFLRVVVLAAAALYLVYLGTGLAWSLIPWGLVLLAAACVPLLGGVLPKR